MKISTTTTTTILFVILRFKIKLSKGTYEIIIILIISKAYYYCKTKCYNI